MYIHRSESHLTRSHLTVAVLGIHSEIEHCAWPIELQPSCHRVFVRRYGLFYHASGGHPPNHADRSQGAEPRVPAGQA